MAGLRCPPHLGTTQVCEAEISDPANRTTPSECMFRQTGQHANRIQQL